MLCDWGAAALSPQVARAPVLGRPRTHSLCRSPHVPSDCPPSLSCSPLCRVPFVSCFRLLRPALPARRLAGLHLLGSPPALPSLASAAVLALLCTRVCPLASVCVFVFAPPLTPPILPGFFAATRSSRLFLAVPVPLLSSGLSSISRFCPLLVSRRFLAPVCVSVTAQPRISLCLTDTSAAFRSTAFRSTALWSLLLFFWSCPLLASVCVSVTASPLSPLCLSGISAAFRFTAFQSTSLVPAIPGLHQHGKSFSRSSRPLSL